MPVRFPRLRLGIALSLTLSAACGSEVDTVTPFHGDTPHAELALSIYPYGPVTITVAANSSGNIGPFWVKNVSPVSGTSTLGCTVTGNLTCVSLSKTSVTLAPGESTAVEATFSTGAANAYPYDRLKLTSPYAPDGSLRIIVN